MDKCSIKYNKNVYPIAVIQEAIKDYQDICKVRIILDDANYYECIFHSKYDVKLIMLEFSNYLLEVLNRK